MRKESKFLVALAFVAVLGMIFFMAAASHQANDMRNQVSHSVFANTH
jgi:hypothetical protein